MNVQAESRAWARNPDVLSCIANLSNDEVFTPPELVNQMLDALEHAWAESNQGELIWANPSVTFLDPCTKSGVFLREIVRRLVSGQEDQERDLLTRVDRVLRTQVFGIGVSALTSLLARRSVYCSKFADGDHSVFKSAASADGNIWFGRTQHNWGPLRCHECGASRSEYEREDALESHAYRFIHGDRSKAGITSLFGEKMNFDVVIGNPPYQLSDSGHGASARPIYQLFVDQAKALDPRFISMITPSRWFVGGKGLDSFRQTMLADRRLISIDDFANSTEVFTGVDVAGGVSFFLWGRDYDDVCMIRNWSNGSLSSEMQRPLDEFEIFVRDNKAVDLIRKVLDHADISQTFFREIVSARKPFGLDGKYTGVSDPASLKDPVKLRGRSGYSYIERDEVSQNEDWIDCWKVMTSRASSEHAGQASKDGSRKVFSRLEVLPPGTVCTETYRICFASEDQDEVENVLAYFQTKFVRYLVATAMITQDITRDSFMFVPVIDTGRRWDDDDLFNFFGFDETEISAIESAIRPMETDNAD